MNNIRILSLTGAVLTGAAVFWEFSFGVLTANHIYDVVIGRKCSFLWYLIPVFFALAALWGMRKKVVLYEYALRPLWLTSVILFFNLFCTEAFCYVLAVFSWSAFRLGSLVRMPFSNIKFPEMKWAVYSVILLTILTLWNSFYIQDAAFKALYLVFGDWGQYAECYLQLASGSATLKQWLVSAGHCNGLVNLIMAAAVALVPSPRTIFFVNAAVLASALPLSFLLARCSALKPGTALLCAGLAAVYPIFTRQSLCLFYGFHPIVFFIPLLLCFFIARSKKSLWGMTVCVVLSLFVQETVAIFWVGWGLYLFAAEKKFLAGTLLALGMAGWFAFLTLFLQPWGGDAQVYAQSFRYAALGSSPLEIAMSPFCKPAVFWSFFFSLRNITFAALILVPSLFAVIPFPAVLLTGLPLLGGFFMQSSEAVKTPLLQYGVELGTLCWALAIVNLGRLYKGEKSWLSGRGRIFNGTLCALTAGILIGYIYFGYGYKFGLYPGDHCYFGEDASKSLNFLKKHLPEKLPRQTDHSGNFPAGLRPHLSGQSAGDPLLPAG